MDLKPPRQLSLRYTLCDSERNEEMAESAKVLNFIELTSFETFVALDFFLQLQMEGLDRINDPLDLLLRHSRRFETCAMLRQPNLFFLKARGSILVFSFVANHMSPPYLILMMPRGVPSRRDWRKSDGNSSSLPHL